MAFLIFQEERTYGNWSAHSKYIYIYNVDAPLLRSVYLYIPPIYYKCNICFIMNIVLINWVMFESSHLFMYIPKLFNCVIFVQFHGALNCIYQYESRFCNGLTITGTWHSRSIQSHRSSWAAHGFWLWKQRCLNYCSHIGEAN